MSKRSAVSNDPTLLDLKVALNTILNRLAPIDELRNAQHLLRPARIHRIHLREQRLRLARVGETASQLRTDAREVLHGLLVTGMFPQRRAGACAFAADDFTGRQREDVRLCDVAHVDSDGDRVLDRLQFRGLAHGGARLLRRAIRRLNSWRGPPSSA